MEWLSDLVNHRDVRVATALVVGLLAREVLAALRYALSSNKRRRRRKPWWATPASSASRPRGRVRVSKADNDNAIHIHET